MPEKSRRRVGRPRKDDVPPGMPSTRERILESATELFAERGYAQTSLAKVAAAADVTTGSIYGYFDSKGELLVAVVERALRALPVWNLLETGSDLAAAALYARLAALYAAPKLHRVRRLAVEVHAAAARDKSIAELVAQSNAAVVAAVRAQLEAAAVRGEIAKDVDLDHAARFLLIVIMGLAHLETLDPALVGDRDWELWLRERLPMMLR